MVFFKLCRKALFLFVSLVFVSRLDSFAATDRVDISYGKNGMIKYDLNSGKMDIYLNGKLIFYNGYAQAKNNDELLYVQNYKTHNYSKKTLSDLFGKGIKHTIEYRSPGLPIIKHCIYTYPAKDYFFIEITLEGKNLKSNYLAPLIAGFKNDENDLNNRSLFVPFDNDAWIRYDAKECNDGMENTSSEVGAVYNENSGNAIVAGSVEHMVWKSGVATKASYTGNKLEAFSGYSDKDVTRDQRFHGFIEGDVIRSAKFFVGYFDDWRTGLEEYGKANRKAEVPYIFYWNKATPIGWNSWGALQTNITYSNATRVVDFFADSLSGFRSGKDVYVDLDSYWDKMIKGGLEGDYSELKSFATYCLSKGVQPGVYWAPFTDWGFKAGKERRVEGSSFTYGDLWTKVNGGYHDFDGARALDPTHPGTQERIKLVIGKLKECGFKMIKIDFLGHGAVEADSFYNRKVKTGMQAYKIGMEYLLKQLGNRMLVYAAISPSMATGRYVHIRRIACDAFKSISETEYTLNSVTYGWWQTYLYNYLDADHVVLANESYGENKARTLSAVITGTFITGDDFSVAGAWTTRAKELFQKKELLNLVADGKTFRPLNGSARKSATGVFWKKMDGICYLAVFNYGDSEKDFVLDLAKAGLSAQSVFVATDVFSGRLYNIGQGKQVQVAAKDVILLKFKI
ncbi:alpha-galactosidase [Arcticibacter tournemirensis]|uniref:Alpha-galactosidase n=1 Tax=Arcticibacter tournemirensis TaxID=699437 RepID=A0A5M9HFG7_9SPHI|nr:alpha-galactosidase [Arcticibacter tournemirensis]KAA8484088.1 alpha-galactosidase [Arcticibacter tournemirensis]TQM51824.1 alpha-galactosidase [Arcticibacter tournemirensis]